MSVCCAVECLIDLWSVYRDFSSVWLVVVVVDSVNIWRHHDVSCFRLLLQKSQNVFFFKAPMTTRLISSLKLLMTFSMRTAATTTMTTTMSAVIGVELALAPTTTERRLRGEHHSKLTAATQMASCSIANRKTHPFVCSVITCLISVLCKQTPLYRTVCMTRCVYPRVNTNGLSASQYQCPKHSTWLVCLRANTQDFLSAQVELSPSTWRRST
jgi:hypothetical protein